MLINCKLNYIANVVIMFCFFFKKIISETRIKVVCCGKQTLGLFDYKLLPQNVLEYGLKVRTKQQQLESIYGLLKRKRFENVDEWSFMILNILTWKWWKETFSENYLNQLRKYKPILWRFLQSIVTRERIAREGGKDKEWDNF